MVDWRCVLVSLGVCLGSVASAFAESPAPSVHWGSIDYPDQVRTLNVGVTFNRFTEVDGSGNRYNAMDETIGFNLITLSWTERWQGFERWSTNLTLGVGPTVDEPTQFMQNEVVHELRGLDRVPVGKTRTATDFMLGGSLTRWFTVLGPHETAFIGAGFATGSIYQEVYGRVGLRRLSLADTVESLFSANPAFLRSFSNFVRFSALGRYSRLFGGSAFGDDAVASESYLGQISVSIGDYRQRVQPDWEFEFAATIDSGLFVDLQGDSIEERFGSFALRFPYGYFETWNDLINGKDMGPTFGATLVFDVLRFYALLTR